MAQSAQGRIEVGNTGSQVRIRVYGRATHLISQPLREYGNQMIRRGYREFVVDLSNCVYLDSTFAGVLAGMSVKLKEQAGSVTLYKTPERCKELVATLGIEPLFSFDAEPAPAPAPDAQLQQLPMAARSREAWAGTILEAHRLLAEAERANEGRFEDVVEFLKAEMPDGRPPRGKLRN